MKILIVAPYCSLPHEDKVVRFEELAALLADRGHQVTVVTSRFKHGSKTFRDESEAKEYLNPEYILINEKGYSYNFSLRRIYSIFTFQREFAKFFRKNCNNYDLVYSAFPLIGTNSVIAMRRRNCGYKYLVDIQDIWPDSLINVTRNKKMADLVSLIFFNKLYNIFNSADKIIAVSQTYADWSKQFTKKNTAHFIPIGAPTEKTDEKFCPVKDNVRMKFFYVGSLSFIYDIETLVKSFKSIEDKIPVEFHVFGGNVSEIAKLQNSLSSKYIFFHGVQNYKHLADKVSNMHVAINPIKANASQSLTNKLCDYLAWGHPILNCQDNREVVNLLNNRKYTVHYEAENIRSCSSKIEEMYLRNKNGTYQVPEIDFVRSEVFNNLVKIIEEEQPIN